MWAYFWTVYPVPLIDISLLFASQPLFWIYALVIQAFLCFHTNHKIFVLILWKECFCNLIEITLNLYQIESLDSFGSTVIFKIDSSNQEYNIFYFQFISIYSFQTIALLSPSVQLFSHVQLCVTHGSASSAWYSHLFHEFSPVCCNLQSWLFESLLLVSEDVFWNFSQGGIS